MNLIETIMQALNDVILVIAMVSLFVFSLHGFSKELKALGSEKLSVWLSKATSSKINGFLLGAALTAFIQSSSAVTSIMVALVDSGVISFSSSLAVLAGSNLGTTFTAWLVSFDIDFLGPLLIVLGTIIAALPFQIKLTGKPLFYLGLILFSLQLISFSLEPLKGNEGLTATLAYASNPSIGILAGILITALVQSSSVTTGLAIMLAGEGILELNGAVAIIIGSNLGTTSTALIASMKMGNTAKKAALANFTFNLVGLVIFWPLTKPFSSLIAMIPTGLTYQVAFAHLIFNIVVGMVTFPFLGKLGSFIDRKFFNE